MYVDNNLIVSGGVSAAGAVTFQTVTGAAGTGILSTNTVDLGVARDIGAGADLFLRCEVGTAFTGLTTLDLEAIIADDAALTTNVTTIGELKGIPLAALVAGARFAIDLSPQLGSSGRRYLGARFTPQGAAGTAGTLFADFGIDTSDAKAYASGFSVI
jgi:hypothetical protein